jgi:hypothetical protein
MAGDSLARAFFFIDNNRYAMSDARLDLSKSEQLVNLAAPLNADFEPNQIAIPRLMLCADLNDLCPR